MDWTPPADIDLDRLGSYALEAAAGQAPEVRQRAIEAINNGEAEAGPDDEKAGWFAVYVDGSKLVRVHRTRLLKVAQPDAN